MTSSGARSRPANRVRAPAALRLMVASILACCLTAASAAAQPAARVSVFAGGGAAVSPHLDAAAWHRVETAHFALYGDVPARTLRGLATDLEALESLLAGLNPDDAAPAPPRAAVLVFAGADTFSVFAPAAGSGEPAAVSGFFLSHPHGDFIVASAAAEPEVRRVLYHEALHRFVRHRLPEAPLWLNEGLAEFYSTLEVGRGEAWVGRPVVEHVVRLQREPRRPLAELLEVDAVSHADLDGARQSAFYTEAWALVHYLLAGDDDGRAPIASYAGLLRSGEDPDAAFATVFGDVAELDRRVGDYLRRAPREPVRAPLRDLQSTTVLAPARVSQSDLDHWLGWLLSHHSPPRAASARSLFESALRDRPGHAGAVMGMGWLEELAGDHDAARQYYAQAVELDPRDPLPPFLEAQSLLRSAATLPDEERGSDAAQALYQTARAGFRRSLQLEPGLAEAWAGLGAAWVADRSPTGEGLDALNQAYRRLPTRDDVLYNLTLLEARLGSRERAAALYARLERRADPEWVERARESLDYAPGSAE
jgi:tetratricopeptide (TPR) repeat protein